MSVHRCLVTMPTASNIPADSVTNTFHFEGSGADPDNVFDMIEDFYNTPATGASQRVASWLSKALAGEGSTMKLYDLADDEPRSPVATRVWEVDSPSAAAALPSEVAFCLSYQAAMASGVPRARRRGRIYLGPLSESTSVDGVPAATFQEDVLLSASELLAASDASVSWTWVVYSPTTSTGHTVVGGWVDNAFDTQRRRGPQATARTLWPV